MAAIIDVETKKSKHNLPCLSHILGASGTEDFAINLILTLQRQDRPSQPESRRALGPFGWFHGSTQPQQHVEKETNRQWGAH